MSNEQRKHLIGGTDAASLIGLGRLSPTMLYLRLAGRWKDDFDGNEATDAGTLFEDHVAAPMAEKHLGMRLQRPANRVLTLPDEPRIGASLDFEVAGKNELADIKLTGSRHTWGEPGEKVPLHVAAQMQFQMAVARAAGRAVPCVHVIAMFVPGFTIVPYPIEEDRQVGDALLGAAKGILRAVDEGKPPAPGSEVDARALFLGRRGESHVASQTEVALMEQLRILKASEDDVQAKIKEVRDALIPAFGSATEIFHPDTGELLATFRPNRVFDVKAFAQANPDIVDRYVMPQCDWSLLRKENKKLCEKFMAEPAEPWDQTRVFKLKEVSK